uniref:Matrin-type domain-containing protein n=1 Tax=Maylandia zebra TaxID=106582 RepID=A0A3P9CWT5_9CICH
SARGKPESTKETEEEETTEPLLPASVNPTLSQDRDSSAPPGDGQFVIPKSGFFCNICSVFYLNEKTAKELHCCSQKHYNNLQVRMPKKKKNREPRSTL